VLFLEEARPAFDFEKSGELLREYELEIHHYERVLSDERYSDIVEIDVEVQRLLARIQGLRKERPNIRQSLGAHENRHTSGQIE